MNKIIAKNKPSAILAACKIALTVFTIILSLTACKEKNVNIEVNGVYTTNSLEKLKEYLLSKPNSFPDSPYEIALNVKDIVDLRGINYIFSNSVIGYKYFNLDLSGSVLTRIEHSQFSNCGNFTGITLPNSVETIGVDAFYGCEYLTVINIPENVTQIGEAAFNKCIRLNSINVSVDNAMYSSDNGILYNKDKTVLIKCPQGKIGEITIPNSITGIEENTFSECKRLTSVTIPNSVTGIWKGAFSYCESLTDITIPGRVYYIGEDAFPTVKTLFV